MFILSHFWEKDLLENKKDVRDNEKNVQTIDYVGTYHLSLRKKNVGQAQTVQDKL
ncbi:hypothetical protein AB3U99_01955 [Niallia sp. JL1B1071]|uniref:hypothetical protein n=1 Tax=Niallia tiangongensis TaxID=3237105 RepID=UPI0037DC544B